jgi:membrane protease YdiL (CAAX protease family)
VTGPAAATPVEAARPPATPWPLWPGWLVALLGLAIGVTGLFGLIYESQGWLELRNPGVLVGAAVAGGVMVVFGFVYESVRSIRARSHLPATRYRGPSILVLLALTFVLANVVTIPFFDEVMGILEGRPIASVLAALAVLCGTQAALLLVVAAFVHLPRVLTGVPPLDGGSLWRSVRAGIGFGVVGFLVIAAVGAAWVTLLQWLGLPTPPQPVEPVLGAVHPLVVVFATVILAPVAEEIFFRGVAFTAWTREYGRRRAYLGSAVVFALIHLSLPSVLPIFLLGLGLAWVYERTRSLLSAILIHATFNAIGIAIFFLERAGALDLPV